MKKRVLIISSCIAILASIFSVNNAFAQCPLSSFPVNTTPVAVPCGSPGGSISMGSGTYAQITVVNGACYQFSTCNTPSGLAFNTQITGYNVGGSVVFYNNDNGPVCSGTLASAEWVANYSGTLRIMLNRSNCFGHDQTGNSAVLTYSQIAPVITSSSSDMCPGQVRNLTATSCGSPSTLGTWSGTGVNNSAKTFTAPSTPGSYTITYTLGACSVTQTINVVAPSVAATNIVGTLGICPGGTTTLVVNGGTLGGGAQWVWYSGSCGGTPEGTGSSITVSPSSNTTYFVRAEGTCGNTACVQATVTINTLSTQPTGITVSNSSICAGTTTTLTQTGGTLGTGSNYFWYIGSCGGPLVGSGPSITVSPLSTTTYFVRAEGPCNTTSCFSTLITVTPAPNLSVTNLGTPSACGASDGFVTVQASGGTQPYSYLWSTGASGATLSGASAGGYCVTVTDGAGCTDVFCIAMSDPGASPAIITSSDVDQIICQGESVTFTASGGYIYDFETTASSGPPASTTPTWTTTGLQTGEQVWVISTDFNFCSFTTAPIGPFTVKPTPVITETVTDPSACAASDGSITTVVSGGTFFTYDWFGPGNGPDTLGLPAGPYTLTVTNQDGCTTTETYALSDPGAPPTTIITNDADSIICAGELITFAASGSVTYNWFVNGPQVATNTPTYNTDSLTNPSVVVATGTDGNNCTSTSNSIPITVLPGPTVGLFSSDTVICVGDVVTFTATGADMYEFFLNGASLGPASNTFTWVSNTLNDLDSIQVLGTDVNGCPVYSTKIIMTVTPPPTVSLVNLQHPQSCGASDGFITVAGTGGSGAPYTYIWNNNTNQTGAAINGINSGLYVVEVTDAAGCDATDAYALSDIGSTPTTMTDTDVNDSICFGEAVTFTASGGSTYAWYINGDTTPVSTVNPFTTTGLMDGDWVAVIGFDTALCASTSQPTQFTVLPEINTGIVAWTDPTACGASDGTASAIIVGGWPPYSPMWTPSNIANTNATGLSAGIHIFTVTDFYGCSATASVALSDVGAPTVTMSNDSYNNTVCENDTVTFTAAPGTGLTYNFFAPGQAITTGSTNPHVTAMWTSGLVSVLGTDQNNCTGSAQQYISVSPAPQAGWNSLPADVCQSVDTVLLTGGAPAGGTYEVTYPGNQPVIGNWFFPSALAAGPHQITYVTEDPISGCEGRSTQTINVNASPVVNLGADTTACGLVVDATPVSPGTYTYVWSPVNPTPGAATYDLPSTGVYYVSVTDNSTGCVGEDAIGATILPIALPQLNFGDTVGVCTDSSFQACVLNPSDYNSFDWGSGPGVNPCYNVPPVAQPNQLTVTNLIGCSRTIDFASIVYPEPNPSITIVSGVTEFCKGGNVVLSVGGPWASVLWNSGSTTSDIVVNETGNYCVTVLDANGCIDSVLGAGCVDVTVWNPNPLITRQGDDLIIYNNPGTWDVQWYYTHFDTSNYLPIAGAIGDTLTMTNGGYYYAVVTDENGCESTTVVYISDVSVNDLEANYDVNVYPNPTEGVFTLQADFGKSLDARIELRNVLSQLVIPAEDINSSVVKKTYNLNHLPSGVYIISIETKEGRVVKRINKN